MQLNLDVCGFHARKLEAGCDGVRVRILTQVHSVRNDVRTTEEWERKAQSRHGPWLENLIGRFVGVVPRKILPRILLGECPFEAFERIRVEEVVGVVRFVWWVMRHCPVRGGGWR